MTVVSWQSSDMTKDVGDSLLLSCISSASRLEARLRFNQSSRLGQTCSVQYKAIINFLALNIKDQ